METKPPVVQDGMKCTVVRGTHTGKSGIVRDVRTSKTGSVTITVVQTNGDRFKTLLRNVTAAPLLLIVLLVAPVRAQQGTGAGAGLPASIELPAGLDRVLRDYERTWRAGDASALAALFTPDGFVLQPGRLPARGRTALRELYADQAGGDLHLRPLAFATGDTVGYIIGTYRYGSTAPDQGKFTLTLRRDRDGRWLIASDMDNGNRPATQRPRL